MKAFLTISTLLITCLHLQASLFESRPVHPLEINSSGTRLLATNAAEGRLSVFAVGPAEHPAPLLISEIPVGLVPVTVRLLTDDEAWVVNELSDTISIVSLSADNTIATIQTGDEPADLVFANGKAFLSCSRDNSIEVYDTSTHDQLATIPLQGLLPRALSLSPDGSSLHVAFLHTSNGTTMLPRDQAPAQSPPAYTDPSLPAPPQTAQIIPVTHPSVDYTVLDHDLATINTSTHSVTNYTSSIGTNILALATLPNGDLLAANSEARNLVNFETELKGRFAKSRLAHLTTSTTQLDLNDDPDATFPNINTASATTALAQPMALLPIDDNTTWLAAYGSDRIAKIDLATHTITHRIDLRSLDSPSHPRGPLTVRGPRGLVAHPTLPRLYSFNKLSHTLSVIDTSTNLLLTEVSLASIPDLDPDLKMGRAFLHDARLSGNGARSPGASCHIDLERDGLAWDLGDPYGSMQTIPGALRSLHAYDTYIDHELHPLKGPMITQTLIGLSDQTKLHWRGDRSSINDFNATFENLLGGSQIPSSDMEKVTAYLLELSHHPNPHLNLDRTLPSSINGGDPTAGITVFTLFDNHCSECHSLPSGTSNNLDLPSTVGSYQPLKDAPLRTTYHRLNFDSTPGATNLSGFGLLSDGTGSTSALPIVHPYQLHILDDSNRPQSTRDQEKSDLLAFLLSFDTGTPPAVGHNITFSKNSGFTVPQLQALQTLQNQATPPIANIPANAGLVLRGTFQGQKHSFIYNPDTALYQCDAPSIPPASFTTLFNQMQPGDVLTALGVPTHLDTRFSIDRDGNATEDSLDPTPSPTLSLHDGLAWPATIPGWYPEHSSSLESWTPYTQTRSNDGSLWSTPLPSPTKPSQFFRLRKTW